MRRKLVTLLATLGLASGLIVVTPANADAAFVAWICNDAACTGGGDLAFTDTNLDGLIIGSGTVGGIEVAVTISQSKPLLADGMDLNFTATNATGTAGSIWFYAADTDFVGPQNLSGIIGGTNAPGGTVTGFICGGTNNSGPSPLNSGCVSSPIFGPGGAFAGSVGPLLASANPYSLAIGVAITMVDGVNGTTTGDLRVTPEPASLSLFGLALFGLGGAVRRRFAA